MMATGPLWLCVVLVACRDLDPATRARTLEPGELRHQLGRWPRHQGVTAPQVAAAIATAKRHGWLAESSHALRLELAEGVPLVVVPAEQLAPTDQLVQLVGGAR